MSLFSQGLKNLSSFRTPIVKPIAVLSDAHLFGGSQRTSLWFRHRIEIIDAVIDPPMFGARRHFNNMTKIVNLRMVKQIKLNILLAHDGGCCMTRRFGLIQLFNTLIKLAPNNVARTDEKNENYEGDS